MHILPDTEERRVRLLIALPTHDMVPAGFMFDYGNLMAYLGTVPQIEQVSSLVVGTYIHNARNELASVAVKLDVTHILWLDTDMRFPKEAGIALIVRQKPIVGINYPTRTVPHVPIATKVTNIDQKSERPEKLFTFKDSTGLEEVEAIGFGLVLMETRLLGDLEYPWFALPWNKEIKQMIGEDVYFCEKLREAGHKIYVDHDLSKACAHIGQVQYTNEHVENLFDEGLVDEFGNPVVPEEANSGDHDIRGTEDSGGELAEQGGHDGEDTGVYPIGGRGTSD